MSDKQQLLNEYSAWIGKVREFAVQEEGFWSTPMAEGNGPYVMWCAISCGGMSILQ